MIEHYGGVHCWDPVLSRNSFTVPTEQQIRDVAGQLQVHEEDVSKAIFMSEYRQADDKFPHYHHTEAFHYHHTSSNDGDAIAGRYCPLCAGPCRRGLDASCRESKFDRQAWAMDHDRLRWLPNGEHNMPWGEPIAEHFPTCFTGVHTITWSTQPGEDPVSLLHDSQHQVQIKCGNRHKHSFNKCRPKDCTTCGGPGPSREGHGHFGDLQGRWADNCECNHVPFDRSECNPVRGKVVSKQRQIQIVLLKARAIKQDMDLFRATRHPSKLAESKPPPASRKCDLCEYDFCNCKERLPEPSLGGELESPPLGQGLGGADATIEGLEREQDENVEENEALDSNAGHDDVEHHDDFVTQNDQSVPTRRARGKTEASTKACTNEPK